MVRGALSSFRTSPHGQGSSFPGAEGLGRVSPTSRRRQNHPGFGHHPPLSPWGCFCRSLLGTAQLWMSPGACPSRQEAEPPPRGPSPRCCGWPWGHRPRWVSWAGSRSAPGCAEPHVTESDAASAATFTEQM